MIFFLRPFIYLLCFNIVLASNDYKCILPEGCRFERRKSYGVIEKNIFCDIKTDLYEFDFETPSDIDTYRCDDSQSITFRWRKAEIILNRRFKLENLIRYFGEFYHLKELHFWGLNGFETKILDDNFYSDNSPTESESYWIELSNCRLDFYHDNIKLNSCNDFIVSNITKIRSIFQVKITEQWLSTKYKLRNVKYNSPICPLVFANSNIDTFRIVDLTHTFYKRNVLSFENVIYADLNSEIIDLELDKVNGINLDLKLLNPLVFKFTNRISVLSGWLNSIEETVFSLLNEIDSIEIEANILRKINRKQGIKWIRNINRDLKVNFSHECATIRADKQIVLLTEKINKPNTKISRIFPDEDFCMYVDFPFDQLVIIIEKYTKYSVTSRIKTDNEFTCTYLWLTQYYKYYYKCYNNLHPQYSNLYSIATVLNSKAFKSISKCDFEKRISLCNKSNYQIKDIWSESDYYILNKKLESVFKISIYVISFIGLIINSVVIVFLIEGRNLSEKRCVYLLSNSIFCAIILVIELLSWMTECFYPFEVFCPEIRKLVGIQFFKIIFKECLVTLFRFMFSFTYIGVTLTRIGMIGKDNGKLLTFFSQLGVKKYLSVTFFISCLFSWIKYFKYEVNYYSLVDNFPISNDANIIDSNPSKFKDFYFIFNLICDLMNYFVLAVIYLILDVVLVVKCRQILDEKSISDPNEKAEFENEFNRSVKILAANILIGVFFKLPVVFNSILNVYADFYYKNFAYQLSHNSFGEFYSMLIDTGFYSLIQNISEFLFTLSMPIQVIIYYNLITRFQVNIVGVNDI